MGFLMLISPFLNLLLDFLCKFFIFLWMSAYFYGGSDPLTPYHFSDGGSEFWTLPPHQGCIVHVVYEQDTFKIPVWVVYQEKW